MSQKKTSQPTTGKRGPLSQKEKQYILEHFTLQTPEDIARELRRDIASVNRVIESEKSKRSASLDGKDIEEIRLHLRLETFYKTIQEQFTEHEIAFFEDQYCQTIAQFKQTALVLHTEKMQVVDMLRTMILVNRCLSRQKKIQEDINNLNKQVNRLNREIRKLEGERGKQDLLVKKEKERTGIKNEIRSFYPQVKNLGEEYKNLQERVEKLKKELKGNRNDRIQKIEDSNKNFSSKIALLEKENEQEKEKNFINPFRLAMEKKRHEMFDYYKYFDDTLEQPFLSVEGLETLQENEDEDE